MPYRRRRVADGERYTMDEFRAEMQRRGVYERKAAQFSTMDSRAIRRTKRAVGNPQGARAARDKRARRDTSVGFYGAIVQAAKVRLAHLEGRIASTQVACPWARLFDCDAGCRCNGTGQVTVALLRAHAQQMIATYQELA